MTMGDSNALPIRAVLLDLGGTLERDGAVLPGVPEALELLTGLMTRSGEPIEVALVSDYEEAAGPDDVDRLFREYVEIVRKLDLLRFFEPPERRATLSTQAGARKPDRRVFELAMRRLGLSPTLETAVFVTENEAHVAAARELGLHALRFGPGGDFEDWQRATPVLLSALGLGDPDAAREHLLAELLANGVVTRPGEPIAPDATHALEPNADGSLELKRRRFSIY